MSNIVPLLVTCKECGTDISTSVFESLNAENMPEQVALVHSGEFERVRCSGCACEFQPEHKMLYADFFGRAWIVMYPRAERGNFVTLERGVELIVEQSFAGAPPQVVKNLAGIRPRLVFGQHMLTEAVRVARAGLDPALLECAKLLAFRHNLLDLIQVPPAELCFERIEDSGDFAHGIYTLSAGERVGELAIPSAIIAETRAAQTEFETSHPELFSKPYVSMARYL